MSNDPFDRRCKQIKEQDRERDAEVLAALVRALANPLYPAGQHDHQWLSNWVAGTVRPAKTVPLHHGDFAHRMEKVDG